MFRQHMSYPQPGIGGFFPTLAGYRALLLDPTIPERVPAYGSELFPKTGVILRSGFPTDRETQLYMIAGSNHAHYDNDSGSITLWGKGRIVADDFGYYGYAPAEDHSMVESPVAQGVMHVREFASSQPLDYVRGLKQAWTRQVAFVKDPDPLAPNYFAICDSLEKPAPATWRLWLTAHKVTVRPDGALVEGKEDVDTDIFFLRPQGLVLRTEHKTRRSGSGLRPDGNWGPMESTQIGLITASDSSEGWTVLLYPRLKEDEPPVLTRLADGRGVKVQTPAGTDYVFLAPRPFSFRQDGVQFEGTCGLVQMRDGRLVLALGAAGSIGAEGRSLKADRPQWQQWPRRR